MGPAVKNVIRPERAEAGARQARHAGLVESEVGQEGGAVVGIVQLGQLGLEARGHGDDLGAVLRRVRGQRRDALGLARLGDVGDVDHRLGGEQVESLGHLDVERARRQALVQVRGQALEHDELVARALLAHARGALGALAPAGHEHLIGEQQLEVDRLGVGDRVDAAVGVRHRLVVEAAHDVRQRVRRAQVAEILAAEPAVARAAAAHEARDVGELHRRRHLLARETRPAASAAMRSSGTAAMPTLAEACTAA